MFVSIRSRCTASSGTFSESVHSANFSTIHASCPTGESVSAYDTVCGRVACSFM
jgi:hypothetical protein